MMMPTFLKRWGWLGVVAVFVALVGCRDFDEAYEQCVNDKKCIPDDQFPGNDAGTDGGTNPGNDAGTDGGTNPGNDAGTDGGTNPGNDAGTDDGGTNPGNDAGTDGGVDAGPVDAGDDGGFDGGEDAGIDGGTDDTSDAGSADAGDAGGGPVRIDAGTEIIDAGFTSRGPDTHACAAGLCLKHEYSLDGPYEFQGLWGSSPDEVFLAARALPEPQAPAKVVRFSQGRFSASTVDLPGFQPFRLQGTDATNVWAINEAPAVGPCWVGNESFAGANTGPLLHCPSPVFHFDGKSWAPVDTATNVRTTIQPPALYTEPDATWVASSGSGVLRWNGSMWLQEPTGAGPGDQISALWGDRSGLRLGVGSDSHQLGMFRQRMSWGSWARSSSLESDPFVAIAGPDEKNLYAATSSEVLRWMPGDWWRPELSVPQFTGQTASVQDLWVSADGEDVWVTLKTAYVLRKHGGQWSVVHLPVDPGFSALRVQGFDTPTGDLWITGTRTSLFSSGTTAYHYERQAP